MVETNLLPLAVINKGTRYQKVQGDAAVAPSITMSNPEDQLIGELLPTPTLPQWLDSQNDLEIATDGTVHRGQGSAAYTIHS